MANDTLSDVAFDSSTIQTDDFNTFVDMMSKMYRSRFGDDISSAVDYNDSGFNDHELLTRSSSSLSIVNDLYESYVENIQTDLDCDPFESINDISTSTTNFENIDLTKCSALVEKFSDLFPYFDQDVIINCDKNDKSNSKVFKTYKIKKPTFVVDQSTQNAQENNERVVDSNTYRVKLSNLIKIYENLNKSTSSGIEDKIIRNNVNKNYNTFKVLQKIKNFENEVKIQDESVQTKCSVDVSSYKMRCTDNNETNVFITKQLTQGYDVDEAIVPYRIGNVKDKIVFFDQLSKMENVQLNQISLPRKILLRNDYYFNKVSNTLSKKVDYFADVLKVNTFYSLLSVKDDSNQLNDFCLKTTQYMLGDTCIALQNQLNGINTSVSVSFFSLYYKLFWQFYSFRLLSRLLEYNVWRWRL